MGGIGSGRRYQSGCDTTTDYRRLDVRQLQKHGVLKAGHRCAWNWYRGGEKTASIQVTAAPSQVILNYRHQRHESPWQSFNYPVNLDLTRCNLGGTRVWFRCPAAGCGRRVALLYLGSSGIFACRKCYGLAYESQRERGYDRAARLADKICERLGWEEGVFSRNGSRPKGMHLRTYLHLRRRHYRLKRIALTGIAARLGMLGQEGISVIDDLGFDK